MAVAALALAPFTLYLVALHALAPPTEAEWAAVDPILRLLPRGPSLWLPVAAGALAAVAWVRAAPPSREALLAGGRDALMVAGPRIPSFVPPEESAAPGFLLSMTAGYAEEVVCRLGVLPLVYFGLRGRLGRRVAGPVAIVATGLTFSAWHAVGEPTFSPTFFVTRLVIPGAAMSVAWLASPSFITSAHCSAHLLLPALFTAGPAS